MFSNAIRRIFESKTNKTIKTIEIENPEIEDDNNIKNEEFNNEIIEKENNYKLEENHNHLFIKNNKNVKNEKEPQDENINVIIKENDNDNDNVNDNDNDNDNANIKENENDNDNDNDNNNRNDVKINIIQSPYEGINGKAWILSFDKDMTWSLNVKDSISKIKRFSQTASSVNSSKSTLSIDEIQIQIPYFTKRLQKAIEHNKEINYRLIRREQIQRERNEFQRLSTQQKLHNAENRRQQILIQKSKLMNVIKTNDNIVDHDQVSKNTNALKLTLATLTREKILKQIRERASNNVDYARTIAMEKRNFDDEYAAIRKDLMNERLKNAHLRRQTALNTKKLDLKQHSVYTKSVMQNKKNNWKRMSQQITEQLNAAEYRRNLNLEEIQSKAKHHNLMVKTKIKYANAVFETKLLEESLRTDRKHENAYGKRLACLRTSSSSEIRQNKVLSNLQEKIAANVKLREKINNKLADASARRNRILQARKNAPVERCLCLNARKQNYEVKKTRAMLKQIQCRIKNAEYRRLSFIESRRRKCANTNWKVKMAKQRVHEAMVMSCEQNKNILSEKLSQAEQRRESLRKSLFVLSLRDRALSLRQKIIERQHEQRKSYKKKIVSANIRQSADFVTKLDKIIQAQNRELKAASRRETQDDVICHRMKQNLTKRMIGAEIRHKAQIDARKAFARKENTRCTYTRTKADSLISNMRTLYEEKLRNAEERRKSYLSCAVFSAVRDQEKIKLAKEKAYLEREIQKISLSEKQAKAEIRRRDEEKKLSEKARSFCERHYERQNEKLQHAKLAIEEKQAKASRIREAYLSKKIEKARYFSNKREIVGERNCEETEKVRLRVVSSIDNASKRREHFLNTIRERARLHVKNVKNKLNQYQIRNNENTLKLQKHLEEKLENAAARREKVIPLNHNCLEIIGNMISIGQCPSAV